MGGGSGVAKAMTKAIKKHGSEVRVESGVKKILLEGDKIKKAVGVELYNGEKIYAEKIISNADLHKTYNNMIGPENLSKKLNKKLAKTTYSVSSLLFFVTVDMDVRKYGIDSGNIWMTQDIDINKQCKKMDEVDLLSEDEFPQLFISCSTLKDPVSFNGRYHNFEMVTLIDNSLFDQFKQKEKYQTEEYLEYKRIISEKFIKNLEKVLPGVRDHIIQAELGTPKTNEFYIDATQGNVYGIEKKLSQLLFPFSSKSEIENLYLCGASIDTHGLSSACNSGVNVAARILGTTREELLKPKEEQNIRIYDAENEQEWPAWIFQKIKDKNNHLKLAEKKIKENKILSGQESASGMTG
jgi:all-trans-retinol 13,14-reductase